MRAELYCVPYVNKASPVNNEDLFKWSVGMVRNVSCFKSDDCQGYNIQFNLKTHFSIINDMFLISHVNTLTLSVIQTKIWRIYIRSFKTTYGKAGNQYWIYIG